MRFFMKLRDCLPNLAVFSPHFLLSKFTVKLELGMGDLSLVLDMSYRDGFRNAQMYVYTRMTRALHAMTVASGASCKRPAQQCKSNSPTAYYMRNAQVHIHFHACNANVPG